MFNYQIINPPTFSFDEKIVKTIFEIIDLLQEKKQAWTLNIVFVDEKTIQDLNNNYRKKDYVTDVLSFNYYDDFDSLKVDDIAWELVFCEEKIKSQGLEYGLWEEKEFYKLLIHSVLHIIWYDHIEDDDYNIMKNIEEEVWNKIYWK